MAWGTIHAILLLDLGHAHGAFAIRIVFVSPRECGVESLA
jgi:hypothetical protein